jgi:hypothetical protein
LTRNMALGKGSTTVPSTSIASSLLMQGDAPYVHWLFELQYITDRCYKLQV